MFRSFWIAGYESATHRNTRGERLDMIAGVQHDSKVCEDYRLLPRLAFAPRAMECAGTSSTKAGGNMTSHRSSPCSAPRCPTEFR